MANDKINLQQYIQDNLCLDDICGQIADYTHCTTDYIDDIFTEIADNNVSIYTRDLLHWLADDNGAFDYCEQALANGCCDTRNPDLCRIFQAGQYEQNYDLLQQQRDNVLLLWCLHYCIDNNIELSQEQIDNIESSIDCNIDTFDSLVDIINEQIEQDNE